jgi:acyl carrier protein
MTEQDLYSLVAEALEVSADAIGPDTKVEDVEEWNSLGWLSLMSLLDEKSGAQLSSQEIDSIKQASDLTNLLRSKGVVS